MQQLIEELKTENCRALNLQEVKPATSEDEPLFGPDWAGLD